MNIKYLNCKFDNLIWNFLRVDSKEIPLEQKKRGNTSHYGVSEKINLEIPLDRKKLRGKNTLFWSI